MSVATPAAPATGEVTPAIPTPGPGSGAPRSRRWRISPRLRRGIIGVLAVVVVAELASRLGIVDERTLPPISAVLAEAITLPASAEFRGDVLATLTAWSAGLGLAILIAVPLGLVLGSFRFAFEASSAVVEFLRPIPSVALIPLAILIFGQNTDMKIALAVYASIWPIFFNTVYGVRDVEPVAKETAKSFRLGPTATLFRISLPHAAPFIATGVRISAAIALIVTISAELLAGSATGLGAFILRVSSGGGEMVVVFAATIIAGLLGMLINGLLVALERRLFAWKIDGTQG